MTSQKFVLGTIVGGVVFFVLGYLVYGMALSAFFATNSRVPMLQTPIVGPLIVGQLGFSALVTYVIGKTGAAGAGGGFSVGLMLGLLGSIGFDFTMAGTQPIYSNMSAIFCDVAVFTLLSAIAGTVIGAVAGSGQPAARRAAAV